MACHTCRTCAGLFRRLPPSIRQSGDLLEAAATLGSSSSRRARRPHRAAAAAGTQLRSFHGTAARYETGDAKKEASTPAATPPPSSTPAASPSQWRLGGKIADLAAQALPKITDQYRMFGATKGIVEVCSAQAAYTISEKDRRDGTVRTTEDGEEIGVGGGMWHDEFKLLPTFSTWSQVTMLHMYLVLTRLRCLEREAFRTWQAAMADHFFQEAEDKMDALHNIGSRSLRQRYLRDLFLAWRGLVLAYDEGVVRGDAVLAAALWRNLFKGREDVDARALAAVVSWMRQTLRRLDGLPDAALFTTQPEGLFAWPARNELPLVDKPAREMAGLLGGGGSGGGGGGAAAGAAGAATARPAASGEAKKAGQAEQ